MQETQYYKIEKAIDYLSLNSKSQPSLEEIAKELNLSTFHFQRLFKQWAGISPKKFLQYLTLEYTKDQLISRNTLDVTYDAGLSSISRLFDLYINFEAITPAEFKTQGANLKIYYGFHKTVFGNCLIAITKRGICGLHFISENNSNALSILKKDWPKAEFIQSEVDTHPYFKQIFEKNSNEKINIFVKGTNFQVQVWKALLKIQEGSLKTYEDVAFEIGRPKALRAVGTAIGHNPISYLIPCHRVINKIGKTGNYRWGSSRKKAMLVWERSRTN